ncbi:MAG: ComF family protein [Burkholderiales bacterium]|nr:ComF family protein [Burkholderiales bacterium]
MRQHALPPLCLLCSAHARCGNLCAGCRSDLPHLPVERCPKCAAPSRAAEVCGACLAHPPAFDRVLAPCAYAFPLDRLIQSFKYGGKLAAAPALADLMWPVVSAEAAPDLIVPMPLGAQRLRERGFNQSLELARLLAARMDVPLARAACARVRDAAPQSALPWKERDANVRGAFVCTADVRGYAIAVVDDVLTTGATLNELSRVLYRAGAVRVTGWVAARTLAPEH